MPSRLNARSMSITSQESYQAVMIADLVAEVQQDPPPPPLPTISKGVVLDASSLKKDGSLSTLQVKKDPGSSEHPPMSTLRKLAMVASFSPAVLFVLGFAVLFPCKVPCGFRSDWSLDFKNTEFTHQVLSGERLLLSSGEELHCLDVLSGHQEWKQSLSSALLHIECGLWGADDSDACAVVDESRLFQLIRVNDGRALWNETSVESAPAIVSDCDGDGRNEIVVPLADGSLRLLYSSGSDHVKLELEPCTSSPTNLMSWKRDNLTSDLLFLCGNHLFMIAHEDFCYLSTTLKLGDAEVTTLLSNSFGELSGATYLPTPDGLAVWSADKMTWIGREGDTKWTFPTLDHHDKNRFLVYASSDQEKPQVILYSSDIKSNLTITGLNTENGSLSFSKSMQREEMQALTHLRGTTPDFLIFLKRKLSDTNLIQEELTLSHVNGETLYTFPTRTLEGELKKSLISVDNNVKTGEWRVLLLRVSSSGTSVLESATFPSPGNTVASCLWK